MKGCVVVVALCALGLWACEGAVETACIPGQSIACVCSDGLSGSQICSASGAGFAECSCYRPDIVEDVVDDTFDAAPECMNANQCDDGNLCTTGLCDAGTCVFTSNTNGCDDENPCTLGDKCKGGSCQPGEEELTCHDGNPCTDDTCDPAEGCVTAANTEPCDDDDPCTIGDICADSACTPGPEKMACDEPADAVCEGDTAISYGSPGFCTPDGCEYPEAPKDCKTSGMICVDGECVVDTGPGLTLDGDLIIQSLEDVESAELYETVTGDVIITDQAPPMLSLSFLKQVGGKLSIVGASLTKDASFPKLEAITGDLEAKSNDALEGLKLPVLVSVGGAVNLDKLPVLKLLTLPIIETIGARLSVTSVDKLKSLTFNSITALSDDLIIRKAAKLQHIHMTALETVSGSVWLSQLTELKTLNVGLLNDVGNRLEITHIPKLLEIDLDALTFVGSAGNLLGESGLIFQSLEAVTVIHLGSLQGVRGELSVDYNPFLANLDLPLLEGLGALRVTDNGSLQSLDLSGLTSLFPCWEAPVAGCDAGGLSTAGWLTLSGNAKLKTALFPLLGSVHHTVQIDQNSGLTTVMLGSVKSAFALWIEDNPSLESVDLTSLKYLPSPTSNVSDPTQISFSVTDNASLMTLTLGSLVDMKGAIRVTGSPKLGVLDVSTLEVCAGIEIVDLGIKTLDLTYLTEFGQYGAKPVKPMGRFILSKNKDLTAFKLNPGFAEPCWGDEGVLDGTWGEVSEQPKMPDCMATALFGCGTKGPCAGLSEACPITTSGNLESCACHLVDGLKITCLGLSDCGGPGACLDDNLCSIDLCELDGTCFWVAKVGTCSDGDPCTVGDTCDGLECTSGAGSKDCDDGEVCTLDGCQAQSGCYYLPQVADCDDGDPCSQGDQCENGVCVGDTVVDCDDGNECTIDLCNANAECEYSPSGAEVCDDGDPCTLDDTCNDQTCVSGTELDTCDDDNACTEDACLTGEGCSNTPVEMPCDDGDPCTVGDVCEGGVCQVGPEVLVCDQPPPSFCVGDDLFEFQSPGVCAQETCAYAFKTVDCTGTGQVCVAGSCVDP